MESSQISNQILGKPLSYHDTHCHLEMLLAKLKLGDNSNDNLTEIDSISKLLQNHQFALQSTVSTSNFLEVYELFQSIHKVKYFLGSHPEIVNNDFDLEDYLAAQQLQIQKYNIPHKIIGIGEIGLDYHYTQDIHLISTQKKLFESQIILAISLNLPIMIHCREAFEDVLEILGRYPQIHNKFLIHCFTGRVSELVGILKLGGLVAFGGISTFKSAICVQEAVKICPLKSFVLETDLPFLAPIPHRGQVCLPQMIDNIAQKIADLKEISKESVWQHSLTNTQKLFKV